MFENAEKNTCQCRIYIYVYSCIPGQIILVTTKILYIVFYFQASREEEGREKQGKNKKCQWIQKMARKKWESEKNEAESKYIIK